MPPNQVATSIELHLSGGTGWTLNFVTPQPVLPAFYQRNWRCLTILFTHTFLEWRLYSAEWDLAILRQSMQVLSTNQFDQKRFTRKSSDCIPLRICLEIYQCTSLASIQPRHCDLPKLTRVQRQDVIIWSGGLCWTETINSSVTKNIHTIQIIFWIIE